jgi:hypothetical protein
MCGYRLTEKDTRCMGCRRIIVAAYPAKQDRKPELLTVSQLREPVARARSLLAGIEAESTGPGTHDAVLWGLFTLAVSSLEVLTTDLLKVFMWTKPIDLSKLEGLQVRRDDRIPYDALAAQVDKAVTNACKGASADQLMPIVKELGLRLSISRRSRGLLTEMRATRNALLHHGLEYTDSYARSAGRLARSPYLSDDEKRLYLPLDQPYVRACVTEIKSAIDRLGRAIDTRYGNYTRLVALRHLWYYMFWSPILIFDDHWGVDEAGDRVIQGKQHPACGGLSSTERMFYGLWKSHFHGHTDQLSELKMSYLDSDARERMMFFLSVLSRQKSYELFGS